MASCTFPCVGTRVCGIGAVLSSPSSAGLWPHYIFYCRLVGVLIGHRKTIFGFFDYMRVMMAHPGSRVTEYRARDGNSSLREGLSIPCNR